MSPSPGDLAVLAPCGGGHVPRTPGALLLRVPPSAAAHTARFMPASAGRSTACTSEEALVGAYPLRLPGLRALNIAQERHALHHPGAAAACARGAGGRASYGARSRSGRSRLGARRARGDGAPHAFGRGSASGAGRSVPCGPSRGRVPRWCGRGSPVAFELGQAAEDGAQQAAVRRRSVGPGIPQRCAPGACARDGSEPGEDLAQRCAVGVGAARACTGDVDRACGGQCRDLRRDVLAVCGDACIAVHHAPIMAISFVQWKGNQINHIFLVQTRDFRTDCPQRGRKDVEGASPQSSGDALRTRVHHLTFPVDGILGGSSTAPPHRVSNHAPPRRRHGGRRAGVTLSLCAACDPPWHNARWRTRPLDGDTVRVSLYTVGMML